MRGFARAAKWIPALTGLHLLCSYGATVVLTSDAIAGAGWSVPLARGARWLTNHPRLAVLEGLARRGVDVGRNPAQMLGSVVLHSLAWAIGLYVLGAIALWGLDRIRVGRSP